MGSNINVRSSPRFSGRELLGVAAVGSLLALALHWPLPLHLGRDVPRDIGDPLVQAWEVAWDGHALTHQPLHFFSANTFWPLRNSLAFSDALVGYAPLGLVGKGVHAAIVRYNLLFLLAYALAFLGAYLLARELGVGPLGAAVAGAAFAYAPWRLEQDGHLHVISSGGIPLALFLLLRGYRRRRAATVVAGWLVVSWQLLLGFTLGLQLAYLLAALALVVLVRWLRYRFVVDRKLIAATIVGVAVFALAAAWMAHPYLEVRRDHPEAHRTRTQLSGLSGPIESYLAAPEDNFVWGKATGPVRDHLTSVPEQTLFPGVAIVALAIMGVLAPIYSRRLRIALALAVLAFGWLALGFHQHGVGRFYPYRLLYELAPGWQAIRVPGRLTTLTSLALALLASAGAQWLGGTIARRRNAVLARTVGVALVAAILVEGSGLGLNEKGAGLVAGPTHATVPHEPPGEADAPAPTLHLPITVPASRRYVLWSADGFRKIVNGRGSFAPTFFEDLAKRVEGFPDARSVALLRSLGVRSVVLHRDLVAGTPWRAAEARPIERLGLRREHRGSLVVYEVAPSR